MKSVLQTLLWVSLRSCIVIAAVMLLRALFLKAPKWTRLLLWGIAALSLILPWRIESPVSLIPRSAVERVDQAFTSETKQNNNPSTMTDNGQTVQTAEDSKPTEETSIPAGASTATSKQSVLPILLASLCLLGTAVMLLYALGSYLKLRRKTAASIRDNDVYYCDDISTPFVLGAIRQRIDFQCMLNHYDRQRTGEYIRHQLKNAGTESEIFTEAAIQRIYEYSSGIARVIDKVCTSVLIYGSQNRMRLIDDHAVSLVLDCEFN